MPQDSSSIIVNDDVASAVTNLVREAKRELILVSPYNNFWDHLKNDIRLAITKRRVQVTVISRERESKNKADIDWLRNEGATIYEVDRLHAKIYLNESSVLLTSMNLLQSSREKSKEVGIHVRDADAQKKLREYVDDLRHLGKIVSPTPARAQTRPAKRQVHERQAVYQTRSAPRAKAQPRPEGHCIRCGKDIPLDPDKPYCLEHFKSWNKDFDHKENRCHACGREWSTSMNKPVCLKCYRRLTS